MMSDDNNDDANVYEDDDHYNDADAHVAYQWC